jgi:hypothetical protein
MTLPRVFEGIPAVGGFLGSLIGSVGTTLAGMAVAIVFSNVVRRLRA